MGFTIMINPDMRDELIGYLEGLSSLDYQNECWVKKIKLPYDEFDYYIHFLFDDTPLSIKPELLIGYCLRNKAEAKSVKSLCNSLERIFEKYGTELSDREYINLVEWQSVLKEAQAALNTFRL